MVKKLRELERKFVVKPYGTRVHIVVSSDLLESFDKRKLSIGSNARPDYAYAFVWSRRGCGDVYVFLPIGCRLSAVAHEMLHVVHFMMHEYGVGYNEEAWAYHLEELFEQAVQCLQKEIDGNRKIKRN